MTTKTHHLAYISGNPVFTSNSPSGYSTRMREICAGFESAGVHTSIHVPEILHELIENTQKRSRQTFKKIIPNLVWQLLKDLYRLQLDRRFAKKLLEQFKKSPPDIIYECLEHSGSVTGLLRKKHAKTFVLEIHGPLQEDARLTAGMRPLQFIFNLRLRKCILEANALIVVSSVIKSWLIETYGVLPEKIFVEPNGANLHLFKKKNMTANVSAKPVVVGFVGSDLYWHRLDALIEAVKDLKTKTPFEVHIVGMANKNPSLLNDVQKYQLENIVRFIGPIPFAKIPEVLSTFDIGVMPGSNRYGSPIKLFEYGATHMAVIAPDEVPVKEIFQDHQDILLIPSGNVTKLRAALATLIDNPEKRLQLATSMHQKVVENYGWDAIAARIFKHIEAHT